MNKRQRKLQEENKRLSALGKRANRLIRNQEKNGHITSGAYLTLPKDDFGRALRFSENTKYTSLRELKNELKKVQAYIDNPSSTKRGFEKLLKGTNDQFQKAFGVTSGRFMGSDIIIGTGRETAQKIIDAKKLKGENNFDDIDISKLRKNQLDAFERYLNSEEFKTLKNSMDSNDAVEIYLRGNLNKKTKKEILREFRKYEKNEIDVVEVSKRLIDINIFLTGAKKDE